MPLPIEQQAIEIFNKVVTSGNMVQIDYTCTECGVESTLYFYPTHTLEEMESLLTSCLSCEFDNLF